MKVSTQKIIFALSFVLLLICFMRQISGYTETSNNNSSYENSNVVVQDSPIESAYIQMCPPNTSTFCASESGKTFTLIKRLLNAPNFNCVTGLTRACNNLKYP